jgi:hypothetical protein
MIVDAIMQYARDFKQCRRAQVNNTRHDPRGVCARPPAGAVRPYACHELAVSMQLESRIAAAAHVALVV